MKMGQSVTGMWVKFYLQDLITDKQTSGQVKLNKNLENLELRSILYTKLFLNTVSYLSVQKSWLREHLETIQKIAKSSVLKPVKNQRN